MDGQLVEGVFFNHRGGGFDDDMGGATPERFAKVFVEGEGGNGLVGGAGDEGGGDFVGDEDFLDETGDGVFAGASSDDDNFEVFAGVATDNRDGFGFGFLEFWFEGGFLSGFFHD